MPSATRSTRINQLGSHDSQRHHNSRAVASSDSGASQWSEMGMLQGGARTVPVRSASAGRGELEKGADIAPDNPR